MKKRLILIIIAIVLVAGIAITAICLSTKTPDSSSNSQSSNSQSSSSATAPETYTVSFEVNGGTAVDNAIVNIGDSICLSDYITEKEEYYFYSWCTDEELTNRSANIFTPTENCTLYAEWGKEEKYLLSFETGDGSAVESALYYPGAFLATPEDPVRENYSFAGWYKDAEYTREFNFMDTTMPRMPVTVYAKWLELHAIHFNSNGGSEVESIVGNVGDSITLPENPTKEGWVFEGWFESEESETPYELTVVPETTITLIAKWHEQQKDITVKAYINHELATVVNSEAVLSEGENFSESENETIALDLFNEQFAEDLTKYFIDKTIDIAQNPVFVFNGWSFDAEGKEPFNGIIPACENGELEIYANWARSSKYCEVTFISTEEGEADQSYFIVKNTAIPKDVLAGIENPLAEKYQTLGCAVEGFYTSAGLRYVSGQMVVMDMELSPYLYSLDLVYEYGAVPNAAGSAVYGYIVTGYDPESKIVSKTSENLILNVPEYYDDGVNGSAPVLWIDANAFTDYPITEINVSRRLLGIGDEAFKNTKISSITVPEGVYEIQNYVFADCENLETVTFKGTSLSWIGTKIFLNTPYEKTLPRDTNGFVFFNREETIIYGYEGKETEITTPAKATILAGGAFKGDTTVKKVTFADSLVLTCDNAFEGSAIEEVVFGKNYSKIGHSVFKDCKNLTSITFNNDYSMGYIGYNMFQGCTSLKSIDLSSLTYLQYINPYAFEGCSSLSEIKFSAGVYNAMYGTVISYFQLIGEYAFANCTSLYKISLPSSVVGIYDHCFENSAVGEISLYNSLQYLGKYAFANCDNLNAMMLRSFFYLTTIEEGTFAGCDNLKSVELSDYVTEVKASAFENCSKLLYVNFGSTASAQITKIGDYAFRNCTSLRKIVISAALHNDKPVEFGQGLFEGAGYTLDDQVFRQTVIYVLANSPEYSTTSQWRNGNIMYTYKEIYTKSFKDTEYENMTIKPIDTTKPTLTLTQTVVYMAISDDLKEFDLIAYLNDQALYTVSDNDSAPENCAITISKVTHIAGGEEKTVTAKEGKYDLSIAGTYAVTISASDEYGNVSTITLQIVVS